MLWVDAAELDDLHGDGEGDERRVRFRLSWVGLYHDDECLRLESEPDVAARSSCCAT